MRSRAKTLRLAVVCFLLGSVVAAAETEEQADLGSAVVIGAIENLYVRPDETSPVDHQLILGESVKILALTSGFAKVKTDDGTVAWIPERALRRGVLPLPKRIAEIRSPVAHLYASPDVTAARPLLTAPLGARLLAEEVFDSEGHSFVRVMLPDMRTAYVAAEDVALVPPFEKAARRTPADWVALGRRFLGAPYTWGGTTPAGFDCSGLVYRLLKQHGVLLQRNSSAQCFKDPQLVPIPFEKLAVGDLLFFGTEDKIDHEAMWIGDGRVLQATAYGVPSLQVTAFAESPRLRDRFRYARRFAFLPGAQAPVLTPAKLATLKKRLEELAAAGHATYGVVFKDLGTGLTIRIDETKVMHAASTMKTPVLLEVLRRVDEKTLDLDQEIAVENSFTSAADGSPFSIELEKTDGPTAAKMGGTLTLGSLVNEMIVRSSNLATNLVLTLVTPAAVQKLVDEMGAPSVKVRRCVEDTKAYEKGLNNETDAAGMAAIMEACRRSRKLSAGARAKAWDILAAQTFNDQIPAGLHPQSGAIVAHKTGTITSIQHDAAVVRLPDGREYVLVLLASGFPENEEGRKRVLETTRKMSRAVWDTLIAP